MTAQTKHLVYWNISKSITCIFSLFFVLSSYAAGNEEASSSRSPVSITTGCVNNPQMINDGPNSIDINANQVANYFWTDARYIERLVNDWTSPSCVMEDGRPRLTALTVGYKKAFMQRADWGKTLARIEELKKQFPNKAFVAAAEAEYWIVYAWDARGGGYASSVTPEGWRLFKERLAIAEKILIATKPYATELPIWYGQMMKVQSTLSRPADERDKTFLEGTQKFKTYYQTYFDMLNFLLPKWGGSWETVDNLVKWSVNNTKDIDGDTMYARLYWSAYQSETEGGNKFFKQSHATWPKMKKGFQDLMIRHPRSKWNLNNFAKFSCLAGDKKTYLALRKQIGNDVIESAWLQGTSLDLCEAKYGHVN